LLFDIDIRARAVQVDARPLLRRLSAVGVEQVGYTVVDAPRHGRLAVGDGVNATAGYRLTSRQLDTGDVVLYVHDRSDTVRDRFRLAVELRTVADEVVAVDHVITVNVTIRPINDEKFELRREAKLDVLQV